MWVERTFHFDAAHHLPYYAGKCSEPHGHTYTCTVSVQGDVLPATGMVLDLVRLKDYCEAVEEIFDHKNLNSLFDNPTAENMVRFILQYLRGKLQQHKNLWAIRVALKEGLNNTIWEEGALYACPEASPKATNSD